LVPGRDGVSVDQGAIRGSRRDVVSRLEKIRKRGSSSSRRRSV
jgi:hypothetical protein